jgi:hypothetical protein
MVTCSFSCTIRITPRLAARMAMNIRQAFLHDSEYRRFQFRREPPEIRGNLQVYFDLAAFGKSFHVPAKGGSQP